jgi:hypothetical protein
LAIATPLTGRGLFFLVRMIRAKPIKIMNKKYAWSESDTHAKQSFALNKFLIINLC